MPPRSGRSIFTGGTGGSLLCLLFFRGFSLIDVDVKTVGASEKMREEIL
jgi:hypothetical protein